MKRLALSTLLCVLSVLSGWHPIAPAAEPVPIATSAGDGSVARPLDATDKVRDRPAVVLLSDFVDRSDRSDDGPAIQRAINSMRHTGGRWPESRSSGGKLLFDESRIYEVRTPIEVSVPGVWLQGSGNVQTWATAIRWRGEGALFTLVARSKTETAAGFRLENILIHGGGTVRNDRAVPRPGTIAFLFTDNHLYSRPYRFDGVAMHGFERVMQFRRGTGSAVTWGGIRVENCRATYNGQFIDAVIRTPDPQKPNQSDASINESLFRDTLAHKNESVDGDGRRRYAFAIGGGRNRSTGKLWGASNIHFARVVMENQPAAFLGLNLQGVSITGCRVENNIRPGVTDPVFRIVGSTGVWFEKNMHLIVKAERVDNAPCTVRLEGCTNYTLPLNFRKVEVINK